MTKKRSTRLQMVRTNNRKTERDFDVLFRQLRKDPEKYCNYFGTSVTNFYELHEWLKDSLQRRDTLTREQCSERHLKLVVVRRIDGNLQGEHERAIVYPIPLFRYRQHHDCISDSTPENCVQHKVTKS